MGGVVEWVQGWGAAWASALGVTLAGVGVYVWLARRAIAAVPSTAPVAMRARVTYPWRMCAFVAAIACVSCAFAQLPAPGGEPPLSTHLFVGALGLVLGGLLLQAVPRAAPVPPRPPGWLVRNAYPLLVPYVRLWVIPLAVLAGGLLSPRAALVLDAALLLALVGWHLAGMPVRFAERPAPAAWTDALASARRRLGALDGPALEVAVVPISAPLALVFADRIVASSALLGACEGDAEALEGAALDALLRARAAPELRRAAAVSVVSLALVGAAPALADATGREYFLFFGAGLLLQAWSLRAEARIRGALSAVANRLALAPTVHFRARITAYAGLPLVLTRVRGGSVYDLLVAIGEPPPYPRPAPPSWQGPLTTALLLGLASYLATSWALEALG